jgi:hypothetical protein
MLVPQLAVQALMAGSAASLMAAGYLEPRAHGVLAGLTAGASLLHLLLVAAEATLAHATAHAELAGRAMVSGRYALAFRASVVLMAAGAAAPWIGALAAPLALAGLLAYEHAYIQGGQSVPLA